MSDIGINLRGEKEKLKGYFAVEEIGIGVSNPRAVTKVTLIKEKQAQGIKLTPEEEEILRIENKA